MARTVRDRLAALIADFETRLAAEHEIAADLSDMLLTGMITTLAGVDANVTSQWRLSNFLGAASALWERASTRLGSEVGDDSEQQRSFLLALHHRLGTRFANPVQAFTAARVQFEELGLFDIRAGERPAPSVILRWLRKRQPAYTCSEMAPG